MSDILLRPFVALQVAVPTLRDQIGAQLLGRLAFRRNELRLIQIGDFDLTRATVRIHGKGGKIAIIPLGFKALKRDLEVYLVWTRGRRVPHLPEARCHAADGSVGDPLLVQALPRASRPSGHDQAPRDASFRRRQPLARERKPDHGAKAPTSRVTRDHGRLPASAPRRPRCCPGGA